MNDVLIIIFPVVDLTIQINGTLPLEPEQTMPVSTMALEPGGGANIVFMGTRLGLDIVHVGAIGEDYYGDFLLQKYNDEGAENRYLQKIPDFTTQLVLCLNDREGNHAYVSMLEGRLAGIQCPDKLIQQCRAIFISGYMLASDNARETIIALLKKVENTGQIIFFDPGPMFNLFPGESLKYVLATTDVLVLNHQEAAGISGTERPEDAALLLAQRIRGIVVIKGGAKGCYVFRNGSGRWYKGFSVPVVDTTGAGDSFLGSFMRGMIDGWDMETICTVANATGAAMVQKAGSGTQVPALEEVLTVLNTNGYNVTRQQILNRGEKFVINH